jgi:hypothetical protein
LTAGVPLFAAPNATMERSLRTVEPRRTVPPGRTFYRWSVAILAASGAADVASGWRRPEANPAVTGPGSTFGAGSVAIKLGLFGSSFLLERLVLRHRPDVLSPRRLDEFRLCRSTGSGGAAQYQLAMSVRPRQQPTAARCEVAANYPAAKALGLGAAATAGLGS